MSTRTKPQPLSDTEIREIAAEIDAGRPPMVWFTAAAVGVPEGRSGKVMSLGDPSEGDFLQVKPTGSKDVLSFGPTEVTLSKPARQNPAKPAAAPASAAKPASATPRTATRKEPTVTMSSPATMPAAAPSTPPAPEATPQPAGEPAAEAKKASRPARNAAAAAKKPKTPEVTVTLSGTAEGEWTLDVVNGKKRAIKGLVVTSSAVAQAAKILHPEFAEVVDSIHESVRSAQQAKVEQLQAELESARRLLEDLA
ncbi:DUF6319 family protein [Nocardia sp. NPDC005825]|uniref:DUF6319 family protein n=1 Tax=unclassified Nocardia TaxID=2637762 RepID=UPI00340DADAC